MSLRLALATLLGLAVAAGASADARGKPTSSPLSQAFVPSVVAQTARIWAVGDGADDSTGSVKLADFIAARDPARFLYLGDVYEVGTWEEFQTNYHTPYGQLVPVTAPTPGNHEWALRDEGYRPYWREQKETDTVPDYYAFRVAGWKILSLNSEAEHEPGSAQLDWLEHKVRGSGDCRLAFLHRPRWSAGQKGNNPSLSALWRTLRGHARLLLSGDEHNSQHIAMRDGIVQLIAGAGGKGRGRYEVDTTRKMLVWSNVRDLVALRVRLSPGHARFAFVRVDGKVLHARDLSCRRS